MFLCLLSALTIDSNVICKHPGPQRFLCNLICQTVHHHSKHEEAKSWSLAQSSSLNSFVTPTAYLTTVSQLSHTSYTTPMFFSEDTTAPLSVLCDRLSPGPHKAASSDLLCFLQKPRQSKHCICDSLSQHKIILLLTNAPFDLSLASMTLSYNVIVLLFTFIHL